MKDFRGMKRQRSRNRKPSGNQNNPNRAYESNGPDGAKVRGNAQTIYEKYQQLARDANGSGDRVLAENYLQHAEHYFRLIRQMQPQRPVSEFLKPDPFSTGYDFDDDIETVEPEPVAEAAVVETPAAESDTQPRAREDGEDGASGRRESRRERYERRRQQRLQEQEQDLTRAAESAEPVVAGLETITPEATPIAPEPAPVEETASESSHLPAFLRSPAVVPPAPEVEAEAEPEASEAPVKKPRAPRRRKTETVSAQEA